MNVEQIMWAHDVNVITGDGDGSCIHFLSATTLTVDELKVIVEYLENYKSEESSTTVDEDDKPEDKDEKEDEKEDDK